LKKAIFKTVSHLVNISSTKHVMSGVLLIRNWMAGMSFENDSNAVAGQSFNRSNRAEKTGYLRALLFLLLLLFLD